MFQVKYIVFILWLCDGIQGRTGFGPGEQEWGYVDVRKGAHMFWWLYYTTAPVSHYTERPLVIWLQGGPGGSSTGHGNFALLGPLDLDLNERNFTWVNLVNVLFVDNPVGTGFSYVDDARYLTTTNRQIGEDFAVLLKGILQVVPEFATVPIYIFGQSYGGKMAADIAVAIHEHVASGDLKCNLQGIALGNSWISPLDSVLNWAPFLLEVGAVDEKGYNAIDAAAQRTKRVYESGDYVRSTSEWSRTERVVWRESYNVDFYNILEQIPGDDAAAILRSISSTTPIAKPGEERKTYSEDELMNGPVKEALGLSVTWGAQSSPVFDYLSEDFMKPVTHTIEHLLNTTNIKVSVYSGQLDLICCTPGTYQWVTNLQWINKAHWTRAPRPAFAVSGINEGYVKKARNFAFYWINRAGHSSTENNPKGGRFVLLDVIGLSGKVSPEY
ncbi:retinoid-inducible serine carboxypeptidase-like [Agrilus planipennis]|uniref:Retinoid-inducible serine carboxypeptidase n=1 Tax=Agrilus planipennis TaxID=224129 RepID=A0A7F5RB52_AGRPL|nr:retinoid-inducible serine carboxypeptidase-like [Agrilus planipennis]